MEKTKKNNKGFSLVELIVVVLIMAIIAVSLAPQVMKWVDQSRQAVDVQTKDSIVSAFNIAATNKAVYGKEFGVSITGSTVTWSDDANGDTDPAKAIRKAVNDVYNVDAAKCKSSATISVEIDANGKVTGTITNLSGEVAAENP